MSAKKMILSALAVGGLAAALFMPGIGLGHCEIPCGIYDDAMRLDMLAEHIRTIEKSMNQIIELSEQKDKNYNQLVRWVMNKEVHADQFSGIITQYFLTQRIAPVEESEQQAYKDYIHKLTLLHGMMVNSMKCKQTTDLKLIEKLRTDLRQFRTAYLGPESEHEHSH